MTSAHAGRSRWPLLGQAAFDYWAWPGDMHSESAPSRTANADHRLKGRHLYGRLQRRDLRLCRRRAARAPRSIASRLRRRPPRAKLAFESQLTSGYYLLVKLKDRCPRWRRKTAGAVLRFRRYTNY